MIFRSNSSKNLVKKNFPRILISLIITIGFTNLSSPVWAADGDVDTSFGASGIVTTDFSLLRDVAKSIVVQSDEKIVVAGYASNETNEDFAIVRYNTDGTLDSSFGTAGKVLTPIGSGNDGAYSVVLQNDGKILVAGYAIIGSNSIFAVVRYNTDGSLDTNSDADPLISFGTDGIVTTDIGSGSDGANSVVLQNDGKILVAGYSNGGVTDDFAVVRYNTDGTLDSSFGTAGKVLTPIGSGSDGANSVVLQSDGKIVAAGWSNDGVYYDFAVVRYDTNGLPDEDFGVSGTITTSIGTSDAEAYSVVLQSDGKIVTAGYSYNGDYTYITVVRYNTDGSLDTNSDADPLISFDTDGIQITENSLGGNSANSVVVQNDGKILVAGYSNDGVTDDFAVVRYHTDGTLDSSFGTAGKVTTSIGSGGANSVVLQSDGKIVAAGYSFAGPGDSKFAVVRYTITVSSGATGSNDLTWIGAQSITCPAPNPWVNEKLGFAANTNPVLVSAENTIGKTITQSSYDSLKSSGVVFDTVSNKVSTATETLPIYGCKDKLLSGKVNQPIQFIAGGYTLQSNAHGYINTADLKWHDTNSVTLYTNTAAFMHTIKFTKTGKYVVVLTEQPDTSRGLIPTYGVRSVRFVININ